MRRRDYLLRHSLRFWHNPSRFIEDDNDRLADLDLVNWTWDDYRYAQDPVFGLVDHAQPVDITLDERRGDCVDYALLAASWLAYRDHPVYLGFSWRIHWPPGHLLVSDGRRVYESGGVHISLTDYLRQDHRSNVYLKQV